MAVALAVCFSASAQAPTSPTQKPAQSPAPQLPVAPPAEDDLAERPAPVDAVDLGTVVVAGRQPGPGLWKVRKGDNVLWILGTQLPVPKRMEWDSAYVERRIAQSQQVLLPPSLTVDSDLGLFRSLTLIPSALRARKNPDDKTLQDIVPPAQYARWLVLKKRYVGSDRGIEEWRPVFAALELYRKAIARSGMTLETSVNDIVAKAAKKNKVPTVASNVEIKIKDPKAALKAFSRQSLQDQECFARTLDRIEGDLGTMVARANAWAEGDIEALRDLPFQNQFVACTNALTGNELARTLGFGDIEQRVQDKWLASAEAALAKNASTFAVLPVSELLKSNGYLAKLAAKGYLVEEP
jgi:hypothetical protein